MFFKPLSGLLSVLAFSVMASAPSNGLVLYLPFDSNANDASGTGNDGVVSGATLTRDRFNAPNKAYAFNGQSSSISIANSASLQLTSSFSASLFFKYNGTGTPGKIYWTMLNKDGTPYGITNPFHFSIASGSGTVPRGLVGATVGNGQVQYDMVSRDTLNDYKWHNICLVFDGTQHKYLYYVDAHVDTTVEVDAGWVPAYDNSPLTLGVWPAYNGFFNGCLDEVRIYNRPLSPSEVSDLFLDGPVVAMDKAAGLSNTPASFSVDPTFSSIVATYNTSAYSTIDTLHLCFEIANLTYLTQRPDLPVSYNITIGASVIDAGSNIMTGNFVKKSIDITSLKSVSATFHVAFNYTAGGGEAIFANPYLLVYGTRGATGSPKSVVRPQSLLKVTAFPNPTRSAATITYSIPFAATLTVAIYSSDGQLVKNISSGGRQAGRYTYVWDGTDSSGSHVPSGNYYLRVRSVTGEQVSEQIIVLK